MFLLHCLCIHKSMILNFKCYNKTLVGTWVSFYCFQSVSAVYLHLLHIVIQGHDGQRSRKAGTGRYRGPHRWCFTDVAMVTGLQEVGCLVIFIQNFDLKVGKSRQGVTVVLLCLKEERARESNASPSPLRPPLLLQRWCLTCDYIAVNWDLTNTIIPIHARLLCSSKQKPLRSLVLNVGFKWSGMFWWGRVINHGWVTFYPPVTFWSRNNFPQD